MIEFLVSVSNQPVSHNEFEITSDFGSILKHILVSKLIKKFVRSFTAAFRTSKQ